jgi:outer membrane protein insertion porin family
LNESRLKEGFDKLKALYGNLGYVNFIPSLVQDFDEQRKVVNLTVTIDEGRQYTVKSIGFTGNTTTPDEVMRREVLLKEGEVFNASLVTLSLSRLSQRKGTIGKQSVTTTIPRQRRRTASSDCLLLIRPFGGL